LDNDCSGTGVLDEDRSSTEVLDKDCSGIDGVCSSECTIGMFELFGVAAG
jgi:hypothetical protein